MKKGIGYVVMLFVVMGMIGCQKQTPEAIPDETAKSQEVLAQSPSLAVSHSIEGNTVYLTFLTRNFMYAPAGEPEVRAGEGHIHVSVDNKVTQVYTNTFKASDLKPGPHTFTAELVRNNHKPYQNTKISFKIQIK